MEACRWVLQDIAVYVGKNVVVNGLELDLISLIPEEGRVAVHVFEAKSKPKFKLVKQVRSRYGLTDYLYVILPYGTYSWAMSVLPSYVGIVVVDAYLNPHLVRFPRWLGNGEYLLRALASTLPQAPSLTRS